MLERATFSLSDPPEGIALKEVKASPRGTAIVLTADAAVKAGTKGNLIVVASMSRPNAKTKPAAKLAGKAAVPVTALPAIPFEIVAPAKPQ
jgi:hypothetical protein